ncbi:MAG: glutamate mutase L [Chloroflexi bacterium]|nr:glutamate mutase L [Chloroflexota bacterium]
MPASLVDANSLLAVDVGTVTTRAAFFDVVEDHYRFIASGHAPSTAAAPFRDISQGVRQAIENLQIVTGRKFLGEGHTLIMPSSEGIGVDTFAATFSAGPAIKTAVIGLLDDVSLESTQRLARSIYARVVETIGLNDARKPEEQIDSLVRLRPDLILIAGGTDGGATRSVQRLMETVGLACYLLPVDKRPALLFAGNQELADEVKESLQPLTSSLSISPNLRPGIDTEDLQPAQRALTELYTQVRRGQMNGVDELNSWAGNTLMPTASAEGRIIRFLSQVYDSSKGILGVDLGASAATVAAAFGGELTLDVYPQLGLGEGLVNLLRYTSLEDIQKWIPLEIPAEAVRNYLYQKSIYPASLPATPEDLSIEQAVARQSLYVALNSAGKDFPRKVRRAALGLTPYFEPILAAGSVVTRAPTLGQSLLILLDAIQPVGITTVILDQNNLLPALGAAASRNPILPIQVLESGAFLGLATVVAPYVNARFGTPVLRARLIYQNGHENRIEVKQGALEVMPLPTGQSGRLYLQPLHNADLGFGPDRTREDGIPVTGTALGLVIDARGRPLRFPADGVQRREIIKKWLWTLGG